MEQKIVSKKALDKISTPSSLERKVADKIADKVADKVGCDASTGDKIWFSPVQLEELKKKIASGKIKLTDLDASIRKLLEK